MAIREEQTGSAEDGIQPWADLPCSGGCRTRLLEAVIASLAVVAQADGRVHPAERMAVQSVLRRTGLVPEGGAGDALAEFADCVAALQERRVLPAHLLARRMNFLAGGPWSGLLVEAAEEVAGADGALSMAETSALEGIRRAAGLMPPVPPRSQAKRPGPGEQRTGA
ncbi:TerB family tellurite resistance protein [Roseomonas xinghualingensis]|uniref:TerB family tellurite resistance protein n=1 Tax=Roseomonas xinghualingensis TaxID=2986475 RepID=UPI0021F11175|nr:TerB family tellurite resistance protein [Roseomonas sp. SXEYE001]MCV4206674.1 TerB family tellurite resistance protein [Roseomonas sp. SXEYE001]